ncbi:hypothetical protein C2S51_025783 [Perilla frutescens var. frutescens]|nr:hypothetical protein C2S51_025783 [Perilla frutescens var. frutescens]
MKLQELMGSLRTFEMGLTDEETVQKKSIAFQTGSSTDVSSNVPDRADLAESIAMLSKNFSKFTRRFEKSSQNNSAKNKFSKPRKMEDDDYNEEKLKEVIFKESVPASVPDNEVEKTSECSDDEEFIEESAIEAYKKLHSSWIMVVKVNENLLKENSNLLKERDNLSTRLNELQNELLESRNNTNAQTGKLQHLKKLVKMMNSGSSQLDEILSKEKSPRDHTGLGFNGSETYDRFCQGQTSGRKDSTVLESKNKQQRRKSPQKTRVVCHYCEKPGHIRPHCRNYINDLIRMKRRGLSQSDKFLRRNNDRNRSRNNHRNYVVHTALNIHAKSSWYFDSGCSRHITGDASMLSNIQKDCSYQSVTFGDGVKGRVLGRGQLNVHGMPNLEDVLLVERLKANFISISQLCDQGLFVYFTRDKCLVKDITSVLLIDELSKSLVFSTSIPVAVISSSDVVSEPVKVPASVPCDAREVSATLSESVTVTVLEPPSQSMVSVEPSSPLMVEPESLDSTIVVSHGVKWKLQLIDEPEESPAISKHRVVHAAAEQVSDKDEIPISQFRTRAMSKLARRKPKAKKASTSASARRVTKSMSERLLGLASTSHRPLMKNASVPIPSVEVADNAMVHEFYENLSKSIRDVNYAHAFFYFYELTEESHLVWPKGRSLLAFDLNVKYSILHKIAVKNWLPSRHCSSIDKTLSILLFKHTCVIPAAAPETSATEDVPPSVPPRPAHRSSVNVVFCERTRKHELESLRMDLKARAFGFAFSLDIPGPSSTEFDFPGPYVSAIPRSAFAGVVPETVSTAVAAELPPV